MKNSTRTRAPQSDIVEPNLEARLEAFEARAIEAEAEARQATLDADVALRDSIRTEASAEVDVFVKEGALASAAVETFRGVYCAVALGEKVTLAQMDEMAAALPRLNQSRIAGGAKAPVSENDGPTKDDFLAYERGDKKAGGKIDAHVQGLLAADKSKTYSAHLRAVRVAAFSATTN